MRQHVSYIEYYCDLCGKKMDVVYDMKNNKINAYQTNALNAHSCPILPYKANVFSEDNKYYETVVLQDLCDDCMDKVMDIVKPLVEEYNKNNNDIIVDRIG